VDGVDRRGGDYRAISKSIDRSITTIARLKFERESERVREKERDCERNKCDRIKFDDLFIYCAERGSSR